MFGVMRSTLVSHQLETTFRPADVEGLSRPSADDLMEFATIAGAKACGLASLVGPSEETVGVLELADLVGVDLHGAVYFPTNPFSR